MVDDDRADAHDRVLGRAHGSVRCTTMARATRPKDSKKFLVCAVAGQGEAVDPEAAGVRAPRRSGAFMMASPMPTPRASGSVYRSVITPSRPVVGEPLEPGHAVAEDVVVQRADHDVVVGRRQLDAELVLERLAPGGGPAPHDPAPPDAELCDRLLGQLREPGQVSPGRDRQPSLAAGELPIQVGAQLDWSWATLDRIVLRPRLASS